MMEGSFLITILASMGALSLYIVVATIVGRVVYHRTSGWDDDERYAAAIFCGFLFPISVPIMILIVWIMAFMNVPLGKEVVDETTCVERTQVIENPEETRSVPTTPRPKTKFKVGDLITGVKNNPGGYAHLYEGCVCRVLKINGDKPMKVLLIDHIDLNAQRNYIGKTFNAPPRYFSLIKSTTKTKKVAKKKG